MNQDVVISLAMQAMSLALKVALPLLLAGLVVGLIVSIFQRSAPLHDGAVIVTQASALSRFAGS